MENLATSPSRDLHVIEMSYEESEERKFVELYSATPTGAEIAAAAGFPNAEDMVLLRLRPNGDMKSVAPDQ